MDPNVEEDSGRRCGCCCCLKYFIFYILSFLVWVGGLALLATGILNFVAMKYVEDSMGVQDSTSSMSIYVLGPAIYLIVIGSLRFIAFFLGCCGSIKGSTCLLKTFLIVLTVVFIIELILEIGIAVLMFTAMHYIKNMLETLMAKVVESYTGTTMTTESTNALDSLQQAFKCCGASSYTDYKNNINYQCDPSGSCSVPDSCCTMMSTGCGKNAYTENVSPSNIYTTGCVEALVDWGQGHFLIMGLVLLAVMLVMLFTIIFGFCILRHITQRENSEGTDVRMDLLKSEREYDA